MGGQAVLEQISAFVPQVPENPEQDFILSGASFADVYTMAADFQQSFTASSCELICLATEDKAVLAAALLAALAGNTTLLLPNALSKRALTRMQQATGFDIIIADQQQCGDILPANTTVLWPKESEHKTFIPDFVYDAPLIKLFTGGTTGAPAIWTKSGENLFSEACFLADFFKLSSADRIVATISPCHIYGLLFTVLLPLVSSAAVLAGTPSFPAEIAKTVQQSRATIFAAVPAHYRALREQPVNEGTLRLAFSSAGMLAPEDNAAFVKHNDIPIIEVYGSTETGGIATRNRAAGETLFSPFSTVSWKISGSRLAVRSSYISSQTERDHEGFFITGDRVEAGPGNTFLLQGRVDNITKVGGKRVDLDEICQAISKQPGVENCCVLSLPDPGGREHQVCALVQSAAFNRQEILAGLQSLLEPYALPRVLRGTRKIPVTGAGKYDFEAISRLLVP